MIAIARGAVAVTPDDNNDCPPSTGGLLVGTGGTLKANMANGDVYVGTVPAGWLPMCVTRIFSSGTGASNFTSLKL